MAKFHSLKLKDVREETADCKSLAFELPEELKSEFEFIQGQHLTLRAMINGQDVRRNYSLCTSPLDNELRVAIKRLEGGKFSTFATTQLKKGDVLEVMPPAGHFYTELNPDNEKHYVLFAGGSGITPILSIIKTVLQVEPKSYVSLLYGNRSVASVIFLEEIEGLKNKYLERFAVYHFLSDERLEEPILNGMMTPEKCKEIFEHLIDVKTGDEFFVCGPKPMIFAVSDTLKDFGVEESKIHFELFTSPDDHLAENKPKREIRADEVGKSCAVTVTVDGKSFDFALAYGTDNLLDAAMKQGADLPFACKGGVCCTCKARVLEGEVEMDVNYGLVKEEIEAGFVLTCQAFPKSDKVVVNFDDI